MPMPNVINAKAEGFIAVCEGIFRKKPSAAWMRRRSAHGWVYRVFLEECSLAHMSDVDLRRAAKTDVSSAVSLL